MMTFANSLVHIHAYCLANPGVSVLLSNRDVARMCETQTTLEVWAGEKGLTLESRPGGWRLRSDAPKLPVPPPVGTPLDQLHPGNKFRLMFGQSLLVQDGGPQNS